MPPQMHAIDPERGSAGPMPGRYSPMKRDEAARRNAEHPKRVALMVVLILSWQRGRNRTERADSAAASPG